MTTVKWGPWAKTWPPFFTSWIIYYLLCGFLLWVPTSAQDPGGILRALLGVSDNCNYNGISASCTWLFTCLLSGGSAINACGGSFIFTCCVPVVQSDVRKDIIRESVRHIGNPTELQTNLIVPPHNEALQFQTFRNKLITGPVRYTISSRPKSNRPEFRVIQRRPSTSYYNQPECGLSMHSQFSKRIIGGNEAKFAEFPWQAHIRISGYQCGGVLLNNNYVATAAHCVHKARKDRITVHLGEFDTKNTGQYYEPYGKETFSVVKITAHPMFKYMLTQPDRYDIAVLRLDRQVHYRQNIIPICIPDPNDDFLHSIGVVAGWGKTDNSYGKTGTNILRKVDVPIIDNQECLRWHHLKGIDVKLHSEMFCAGHAQGQMDACLGDSGGPLVVYHKGRWTLAGITSAGFGCAVDHQPGIYHKVSKTSTWLATQISGYSENII